MSFQRILPHTRLPRIKSLVFPHVSRLMLFPNRAYNSTFSEFISSRISLSLFSVAETDFSILSVDLDSSCCTSGNGSMMKASPSLYLSNGNRQCIYHSELNQRLLLRDLFILICQFQFTGNFFQVLLFLL